MHQTQAFYEHIDEEKNYPSCWPSANNTCMPHYHSGIELVYIESGEMVAVLNGEIHDLKANDLLIVPSYTVHLFNTKTENFTYVLKIPIDYINSVHNVFLQKTFSDILVYDDVVVQEISRSMKIIASWNSINGDNLKLKGYTYIILGHLLENIPLKDIPVLAGKPQIRDILDFIHSNYLNKINLSLVSEKFSYSNSRFSHIFNESVGCSLTDYIGSLRSRHAANLLMEESNSVIDVAMASGFDSLRTFYRAFKKCFGMTPSSYIISTKKHSKVNTPVVKLLDHI